MSLPSNFYTPNYFDSNWYDQEARMGAQWCIEKYGHCSCNGSGYILTSIDTWIRCGCPLPDKPWVTATIEDYLFDQADRPSQLVFKAYNTEGWAYAETRFCRDGKYRTLTSQQTSDDCGGDYEVVSVTKGMLNRLEACAVATTHLESCNF